MDKLLETAQRTFLDIAMWQYAAAFGAILLGYLLKGIAHLVMKRLARMAAATRFRADGIAVEAARKPVGWSLLLGGLYAAFTILPLPEEPVDFDHLITALASAFAIALLLWFGTKLADGFADEWQRRAAKTKSKYDDTLIPVLRSTIKTFLIVLGVILVLQQLGYSVTSLLAGLGIGTAAVALASKDTIANLFGSIVVFIDRPFEVGDWIEIGGVEGTVEEVGLRTTKIRTFSNSLISLPNSTLTTSAIQNWSRMRKRRIKTTLGITYDADASKVDAAVEAVRKVLREDERILQDFWLVNFSGFGESSLEIFIYAFTATTDWAVYLQVRQEIYLAIMREFEALGVAFAFPSRTVYLAGGAEGDLPPAADADGQRDLPA